MPSAGSSVGVSDAATERRDRLTGVEEAVAAPALWPARGRLGWSVISDAGAGVADSRADRRVLGGASGVCVSSERSSTTRLRVERARAGDFAGERSKAATSSSSLLSDCEDRSSAWFPLANSVAARSASKSTSPREVWSAGPSPLPPAWAPRSAGAVAKSVLLMAASLALACSDCGAASNTVAEDALVMVTRAVSSSAE